jgi:hypothetical protein
MFTVIAAQVFSTHEPAVWVHVSELALHCLVMLPVWEAGQALVMLWPWV